MACHHHGSDPGNLVCYQSVYLEVQGSYIPILPGTRNQIAAMPWDVGGVMIESYVQLELGYNYPEPPSRFSGVGRNPVPLQDP